MKGLAPGDLIFDVGANQGAKTDIFLRLGARVIAVDPDPFNQRALTRKFLRYRLHPKTVTIVPAAVAESEGAETLWLDEPGSGKNTLSRKWVDSLRASDARFGHRLNFGRQATVPTVTLDSLMQKFGDPFFIKIDVEGAEARVLRGLTRRVRYVSFEVNLPDFLEDGLECVRLLDHLGSGCRFNYIRGTEMRLALSRWADAQELRAVLSSCLDPSVEVFCHT